MDVIGSDDDRDDSGVVARRRPDVAWGVPLTAGVALAAALLGFFGPTGSGGGLFGKGTVGGLTGSMVLELQDGASSEGQALRDPAEHRGEDWKGTITVEANGDHTGAARLTGSAAYVPTDSGPAVAQMWGTAEVTLDGQSCTGTYGYSSYPQLGRDGGSMHLRCEQGSVLGATMTADRTGPHSLDGTRDWTITVALTNGYLLER